MTPMARLRKQFGRFMQPLALACALILAAGPIVDLVICGGEAVAAESLEAAVEDADLGGKAKGASHEAICVHGHCHHTAPAIATVFADSAHVPATASQHNLPPRLAPPSAVVAALKRPPRA